MNQELVSQVIETGHQIWIFTFNRIFVISVNVTQRAFENVRI
jgi:hypothetical protein